MICINNSFDQQKPIINSTIMIGGKKSTPFLKLTEKIQTNPKKAIILLENIIKAPQCFLMTVPPNSFKNVWAPSILKLGFYDSFNQINQSITNYVNSIKQWPSSSKKINMCIRFQLLQIPYIVSYGLNPLQNYDQILNRVKKIKESWNLDKEACSAIVSYFEDLCQQEGAPIRDQVSKMLGKILELFGVVEDQLYYKCDILSNLYQLIGEPLFEIIYNRFDQHYIERILFHNCRTKIFSLMKRMQKKPQLFGDILAQITAIENNTVKQMKISNILVLFALLQFWDRIPQNSPLRQQEIQSTLGEAIHRQLYCLYDTDQTVVNVLLSFIRSSSINKHPIIAEKVSYHLLAGLKIFKELGNHQKTEIVEEICKLKAKNIKFDEKYLQWCPQFITASQKQTKPRQEEKQNSLSQGILRFTKDKSFSQSHKKCSTMHKTWKADIEEELKKFNLQGLYLLLQGFKNYIITSWEIKEKRPSPVIIGVIINILAKIEEKKHFRCDCTILLEAIRWQLNHILDLCQIELFNQHESIAGTDLYKLCSIQLSKGISVNIQQIIENHCQYNLQLDLGIFLKLKYLYSKIRANQDLSEYEKYEKYLDRSHFQDKLYKLFEMDYKCKKIHKNQLLQVAYLLSMRNEAITKTILVNYGYIFFLLNQPKDIKERQMFSQLINEQIQRGQRLGIIQLIMNMGAIFEDFDQKRNNYFSRLETDKVAPKYFDFLKRQQHKKNYLLYAKYCETFNYIKQAIFFTQLHCWTSKQKNSLIKQNLMSLYAKMDSEFNQNLPHIEKNLQIKHEVVTQACTEPYKLVERDIQNASFNIRQSFGFLEYSPFVHQGDKQTMSLLNWINFYEPVLNHTVQEMSQIREPQLLKQKLFLLKIQKQLIFIEQNRAADRKVQRETIQHVINLVEKIKNSEIQIVVSEQLLKDEDIFTNFPKLQQSYLELLLSMKKQKTLNQYIESKKNSPNYFKRYLPYQIKQYYLKEKFINVMQLVHEEVIQKRAHRSQIYQMYLESRYLSELNYDLYTCLDYFRSHCTSFNIELDNKQKHFSYLFKMFRMIFQRYSFTSSKHNQHFLKIFFDFVNTNRIMSSNEFYLKETIFYLLRFVLQKFHYTDCVDNYGIAIVDFFRGKFKAFLHFSDYLLRKVSCNSARNRVIQSILNQLLFRNTNQCIWTIAFLKNFERYSKMKSNQKQKNMPPNSQNQAIIQFYSSTWKSISAEAKESINISHLEYIQALAKCGRFDKQNQQPRRHLAMKHFCQLQLPQNLPFPFNSDYNIQKLKDLKYLNSGKSSPLQISFFIQDRQTKVRKVVKAIVKEVNGEIQKYRMESKTANFFEECGLIDKSTTYRIFHISRTIAIIEHVQNIGTLRAIISGLDPDIRVKEGMALRKVGPPLILPSGYPDMRPLKKFDYLSTLLNIKLSKFIISRCSNVQDWWRKHVNFVKTCAQWSMVGYLIGLGDRHNENILLRDDCKIVHIDFQYVIDFGFRLGYPEWVPFRLTQSIVEPLGQLAQHGLFLSEMINVGKSVQIKQPEIWKALSNFVDSSDINLTQEIMSRSKFQHYNFNSIEEGISALISTSRDPKLLRCMYEGWSPHI